MKEKINATIKFTEKNLQVYESFIPGEYICVKCMGSGIEIHEFNHYENCSECNGKGDFSKSDLNFKENNL